MKVFREFHDGAVGGLLLEGASALLFLSTSKKDSFVFKADEVDRLRMSDVRQGNIIFDVIAREGNEITLRDNMELYGFSEEAKAVETLAEVRQEQRLVLEVNASYGAALLLIAKTLRVMSRQTWLEELVVTEKLSQVESK